MNKELTEIIFILDRSGSMRGLESDTIGGYNSFLDKQKSQAGKTNITTVLFDDKYEILYNGVDVSDARIDQTQYYVRGMTALYDAVGKTILDVGIRLSRTPEAERPGKVIMVITTDGAENSSREFSGRQIQAMISHQQEKYNWEFLFFGANIDTAVAARELGIDADNSIAYQASSQGVAEMMHSASMLVEEMRKQETDKGDVPHCLKKPGEGGG